MKQYILNNLKNIPGWHTNKKIVIFAIDDYGNVRIDSKSAREKMDSARLPIHSRFDAYDSLETREDLESLFEILSKFKDKKYNTPIFTAFSVPYNINFERMAEEGFHEYIKEPLNETYEKVSKKDPEAYKGTWALWKEGMEKKLIHPEFHGREHFNLKVFNEKLKSRDQKLITALTNRSLPGLSNTGYSSISFTAAFEFERFEENYNFQPIIQEGLNAFENVFGLRARHFNPPGGREHPTIHKFLKNTGIQYLDTPLIKKEHQGSGKYKRKIYYTGKKNRLEQIFVVRNCVFEPTNGRSIDWVNYTFNQVDTAFKWKRPAIISSHRVNFCGHINPKNREKGLKDLKKLLEKIVEKHPDVEFLNSSELGQLIELNHKN